MADDATQSANSGRKPIHPFFASNRTSVPIVDRPKVNDAPAEKSKVNETPEASADPSDNSPADSTAEVSAPQRNKRRKTAAQDDDETCKKPRGKKRTRPSVGGGISDHFVRLGAGTDNVSSDVALTRATTGENPTELEKPIQDSSRSASDTREPMSINLQTALSENINNSRPRVKQPPTSSKTVGKRKNKAAESGPKSDMAVSHPKSPIADETGDEIDISESVKSPPSSAEGAKVVESTTESPPNSITQEPKPESHERVATPERPKTTHPFFLGKAEKVDKAPAEEVKAKAAEPSPNRKRSKKFSCTPCSPKKPRLDGPNLRMPQFGVKNSGLKFPGSRLPAWPWEGMVHLRGEDSETSTIEDITSPLPPRKSKGQAVKIPASESIVELVSQLLDIPNTLEEVRNVNSDEFLPPPPELRLPSKHFESGQKLQSRILPELRTFRLPAAGKKKGQRKQPTDKDQSLQPPPQLARLFESVASDLSAFDKSQCETANWVQKYTPLSAVEVLQPGQEPFLLRDWLHALMVQSVDTGPADADKGKPGSTKRKAAGPGKKKRKKLDGFIVSSDDEDYGLYALSDDEADWAPSGSRGITRKTVVRPSDLSKTRDGEKIANTLVISGPHGCGKTAAVYAVAKELDFEVFEINPGSKRSGKDIEGKIGEMTKTHLVQHHQPTVKDQEDPATEDEIAKDVKSGKQSTMSAFFKPKVGPAKSKKLVKASASPQQKDSKKDSSNSQRQSLILIEEADILYEEDKQFWEKITSLVVSSRRPFIITCNDETLLPLHILRLHGIFRLTPPPQEYAVDRLILIAANEGHAITRQTAETLYVSRSQDLRAATMDLQFWCQTGVGDRRGGFEWFYPRWPKGIDVDEDGNVVRVVSQETFRRGMNWLARDAITASVMPGRSAEEELLSQCWDFWGLDIGHWQDSIGLSNWAGDMNAITTTAKGRLQALEAFDGLASAMSEADRSARKSFATFKGELIDATHPDRPAKARDDLTLGIIHIHTPATMHFDTSPAIVATSIRSLAKSRLRLGTTELGIQPSPELGPLDETKAMGCIQSSFTTPAAEAAEISRIDFAFAFDPIAVSESSQMGPVSYLDPSVFDRTFKMIILDVAPFVRSIVAYDSRLQKQRQKLSSLVSEGGRLTKGPKRMRTTRAALSALEGGSRSTTRGQTWFTNDLNPHIVMKTAPRGSLQAYLDGTEIPGTPAASTAALSPASSSPTSPAGSPKPTRKTTRRERPRKGVIEDSTDELGDI